ncbi:MAG: alternative ribosome rescue aminoacyl-tRNA hydrolase ArfB [Isosphaeraceae bacterium]
MLTVNDRIAIPMSEFALDYARSGGPGGQNVNKVASKAILRWNPGISPSLPPSVKERLLRKVASRLTTEGELIITSQLTRDQGRNVDDCLEKLRLLVLDAATPPKVRRPTRPTKASQTRRLEAKGKRSETKKLRKRPMAD